MQGQLIVFLTLALAAVLFVWGRFRYDVVALFALTILVLTGVVSPQDAFGGFGHPAVVVVAGVLVVTRALFNSGLIDLIARRTSAVGDGPRSQVAVLSTVVTGLSGFLSSVAAAALFMPVALRTAKKGGFAPSVLLMPIAFASLLGAMLTAIGSAPNIIVAAIRAETGAGPFRMFDYTPVGAAIAAAGVAFLALVGWRLIPHRRSRSSTEELFEVDDYMTEVRVTDGSPIVGESLGDLERLVDAAITFVAIVRDGRRSPAPSRRSKVEADDIIVLETDPDTMDELVHRAELELVGGESLERLVESDEVGLAEAVVLPNSLLKGKTAFSIDLRWRYGVNLLAVSRQGDRLPYRLGRNRLRPGDVLLLQGPKESLDESLRQLGCMPLAQRDLRLGRPRRLLATTAIFLAAVVASATGLVAVQVAFVVAAVAVVGFGLLTIEEAYGSIDVSIIVLLAAMIPVGEALERTGGADLIAGVVIAVADRAPTAVAVAIVLVATMLLSDVINNAAAAVLMAPVAISIGESLGASADPFLMAVAIGASCAFLTPIGHQSNTLVLGPGGYRFGDFWRVGLPLEVIVVVVGVPLIMRVWPPFA